MLRSQSSGTSGVGGIFVLPSFVPEGEFDPVPESELVVDDAKIVLNDVFGGSDGVGDFPIFESLGDKFNDALFPFTGDALAVAFPSEHSCLR